MTRGQESKPVHPPMRRKCCVCYEWFTTQRKTQMECDECEQEMKQKRLRELEEENEALKYDEE